VRQKKNYLENGEKKTFTFCSISIESTDLFFFKKREREREKEMTSDEDKRCEIDIIYTLTAKRNMSMLISQVQEIQRFLKSSYGTDFEKLPEIIGDRNQQQPARNDLLSGVIDRVLQTNNYELILLTFFLFLSFVPEIQEYMSTRVKHLEAFYNWLKLLNIETDNLLRGTSDVMSEYLKKVVVLYAITTPIFM